MGLGGMIENLLFVELHHCNTLEEMRAAHLQIYELIEGMHEKGEVREKKREALAKRRKRNRLT